MATYNYLINAYNKKYVPAYDKEMNQYSKHISAYDKYVAPTPDTKTPSIKIDRGLLDAVSQQLDKYNRDTYLNIDNKRSNLDRAFDALQVGQYSTMGALLGLVSDELTVWDGFTQGLRASNPLGEGRDKWEYSFSDVLGSFGWNPESTGGKIAKGAVGLVGDIFLDPLTYVSGGLSAMVRGSGKATAKVATKGNKLIDLMGDAAKFIDNVDDLSDVSKMTNEMAEAIIKNSQAYKSGLASIDLAKDANNLAKTYNKLLGVSEAGDVILSLGNAPFGKKIFKGFADKQFKLFSDAGIRQFSDATVAPVYAQIRNKILGGKMGKLFSTNHHLYKLAGTNPEGVYHYMKMIDAGFNSGIELSKHLEEVHKFGQEILELTPKEVDDVIQVMQDKTKWQPFEKIIKFIDTKEAEEFKSTIKRKRDAAMESVTKISDDINEIESTISKLQVTASQKNNILDELYAKKAQALDDIDVRYITTRDEMTKYLDELESIKVYQETKIINIPFDAESNIQKTYELYKSKNLTNKDAVKLTDIEKLDAERTAKEYISKALDKETFGSSYYKFRKQLSEKGFIEYKKTSKHSEAMAQKLGESWRKSTNVLDGSVRFYPPEEVTKAFDLSKARSGAEYIQTKRQMVDEISTTLFGDSGFISDKIWDKSLDDLMGYMKTHTKEEVIDYILQHKDMYSGKTSTIFNFIGDKIGYGNKSKYRTWNEYYNERMRNIFKKYQNTTLSPNQISEYNQQVVRYNGLIKNLEHRISSLDGNPKFAKEVQGYREQILEYKRLRGNIKDNLTYNLDLNKRLNQSSFKPVGSDIQRLTSGEYGLAQHDLDLVLRLEKANIERQFYLDNFKGLDSLHEVETVINEIQQGKVLDLNDMINDAWVEHRKNFSLDDLSHKNIDIDFNLSSRERDIVKNDFLDMRYDAKSKEAFADIARRSKKGQTIDGKIGEFYNQYERVDKLLGSKQKALKHARSELAKPIKEGLDEAATTTLLNQRARLRTMEVRLEKDLKELAEYKSKLYKNIIDNISESKKLPTPQAVKDADEIANVVEELLHSKKKSFGQLTPIEREEIYTQAIELRNSRISTSHQEAYNKAIHASSRREKLRKSLDDFLEKRAIAKFDAKTPFSEVVKARISESDELAKKLPRNLDELSKNYDMLDDLLKRSDDLSATLSFKTEVTREVVDESVLQKIENVKRDLNSLDVRMANARETVLRDFDRSVNRLTVETANLDRQIQNLMYEGRDLKPIQIEDISRKIREYDRALSNNEAFINQMYLEFKQRNISAPLTRNEIDNLMAEYNPNLGKYVLDPDLDITDKARDVANRMRESFMEAGVWEVEINKLLEGQYDANFLDYLPHILTPEGELLFKNPDIVKTIQGFGDISGYGTEFNNFAKSRTLKIPDEFGGMIDNPTIEQINKFFAPFTGGKDVMTTNLHDIYIARATKHAELMYDHKYMEYMMDMFGKSYKIGDEVIEGHKVAANYGAMKSHMLDLTNRSINMDIADDISRYLKSRETKDIIAEKYRKIILDPNNNLHGDEVKDNIIKELIDSFMAEKYTPEKLKILREKTLIRFTEETKTMGLLDELSKPLLDLSDEQLVLISNLEDSIKSRRMKIIDDQFSATLGLPAFKDNWHVKQFAGKNPSLDGGFNAFGLEEMRQTYQQLKQYSTNSIAKRIDRYVGHIDDMLSFESLKVGQIPEAVMTKTNHARELQIMKDNNDLLKMFDKFTHFIKVNQTSVMPSFHARNKMSNMFNNWLAIGADAYDIKLQSQIADAMKFRSGKAGLVDEAIEIVVDGKKTKMMLSEVLDMAESYGVINKGIFAIDLGTELESSGLFKKFLPGKLDPTNMKDFGIYKKGTQIGSAIENHDRLIHFVSQVKRGVGFQEAAESVNKFLFDYSDLTIFEASVMKRIMPYYTWLRKNGALQLEMMLEQPEKYRYVSKVLGGVRGMVAPEDRINKAFVNDFALDWIQTPFMVTNPEGRQEPVLWNPNMPFMDLSRLPDLSDPVGYAKDLFTQTNPLLKVPIEIAMNRNVFFDSPLAKEGQSRIGKSIEHTANQMAVVPAVRGMVQKKGLDRALHTLNTTSGLKFLSYDYDKYKAMKIQEIIKSGNKKRPNIVGDVAKSIMNGFSEAISYAVAEVDNSFDAMAQNINAGRPSPDDYIGALRPISEATYNQLSDKEKARYTPPTKEDGAYYHNKAIELSERAYQETGAVKKFVWTLLDGTRLGSKSDDYKIAKVVSVTDGDTFVADFGNRKENVRLLLVDTPETEKRDYQTGEIKSPSMPFGDEAHEYGKEFLFGKDVKLYIDGSDKYGRLLAFVEVDKEDYAESLIGEGLGVFRYDMGANYPQKQTYLDTEMKAYESKKGLWNIEGYAKPNVDAEFSSNYNITEYDSFKKKKINELLRKKDAVRTNPSGWENVLNRLK